MVLTRCRLTRCRFTRCRFTRCRLTRCRLAGRLLLTRTGLLYRFRCGARLLGTRPRAARIVIYLEFVGIGDRGQYVQNPGQARNRLDCSVPIPAVAGHRERTERPLPFAPQHADRRRNGFGERHHALITNATSNLEVRCKNHPGTDRTQQVQVTVLGRSRRLQPKIDVDVRPDLAANGHDGCGLFQVEQHELLSATAAADDVGGRQVVLLGHDCAVPFACQLIVSGRVRVALRLCPDLTHSPRLISPRPVDVQKRTRACECNYCQSEPHSSHHPPG
ncbi:pentapeptide repeat-containing protein [Rhodococcus erythropolis]|uniref:pentapeptide repeat-containing protein n=1 Tax=Rhodococcus erythropolis TaxID=1833 RepID=UPI003982D610